MEDADDAVRGGNPLSRRTVIAGAAWTAPVVLVLGPAPAMATSSGQDWVLLLPRAVTAPEWDNPNNVLGVDGLVTQAVLPGDQGDPLTVSSFEIPLNWGQITDVGLVRVTVRYSVTPLDNAPELTVLVTSSTPLSWTITDTPTEDRVHQVNVDLFGVSLAQWKAGALEALTVTLTPTAPGVNAVETTFSVDSIYVTAFYSWSV